MRGIWVKFIGIVSTLACLLWVLGLGWVLLDYFGGSSSTPMKTTTSNISQESSSDNQDSTSIKKDTSFSILALGDSLTRGVGDTSGQGYVGNLTDHLKEASDQEIIVNNFGISGQTSSGLVSLISQKEIQRQAKVADIILITTGGNDLFQGGRTLWELNAENISKIQEKYLQNLESILSNLKSLNQEATVFLIGLYNPFVAVDAELTSNIVKDWNHQSDALSVKYSNTIFVPTYDLFQLNTEDYLYADKFHPNAEGYKLISERIAALLK